jgi:hypothetical protein
MVARRAADVKVQTANSRDLRCLQATAAAFAPRPPDERMS